MLIAMAGLPGAGKSALANEVARTLGCPVLSVDPIEAAMWRAGIDRDQPTGLAAYVVAEQLAREQLRLGNHVVVDAVNDVEPARDQWRSLSTECGQALVFVEVFCSDEREHKIRLAGRRRGIEGFPEPTWESVVGRRSGFSEWDDERIRLDSMRPLDELVNEVLEHLARDCEGEPALPPGAEPSASLPRERLDMGEARIATVTVKSDRPTIVARFWRDLLGYEVAPNHSDSIMLAAPGQPTLLIQPSEHPPTSGTVHLDLRPVDQARCVATALRLGATRADVGQTGDEGWVVLADPGGSLFCVLPSHDEHDELLRNDPGTLTPID